MKKELRIGKDFTLPLDASTQTFAILAKRRVGKTYTASVIAEEMVSAGIPFVVLDPTGAWFGLRSGKDGSAEGGLPVYVIGGEHGIPLEPSAGAVIADQVATHPSFYVLDLSQFESDSAQDRFATDFAVRLYRIKEKHRTPLHVFIDEADAFVPQRPFPGQQRMLGAFEALVRRGGIRGIGVTLISQRPAIINKNVLTQTECLIALQTTAPQDQDAVREWIRRNGSEENQKIMMAGLASLGRGEAWVWSPAWLEVFKKVVVRERHTFNSSATPKAGEKVKAPVLKAVDLEKLGKQIQATMDVVKQNDPAALKKEIQELRKQLGSPKPVAPAVTKVREVFVIKDKQIERMEKALEVSVGRHQELLDAIRRVKVSPETGNHFERRVLPKLEPIHRPASMTEPRHIKKAEAPSGSNSKLPPGEEKILAALIQFNKGMARNQLTTICGYKRSSRDAYIARLIQKGFAINEGALVWATAAGIAALPDHEPIPTGEALQQHWLNKLPQGEKLILENLIDAYPQAVRRDDLDEKTGFKRSSRDAYLARLTAKELVVTEGQGMVRANANLF